MEVSPPFEASVPCSFTFVTSSKDSLGEKVVREQSEEGKKSLWLK